MSTKFYNAYLLKNVSSLEEIVSFNKELSEKIQKKQKELYGKLIMNLLVESIDKFKVKLNLTPIQKKIVHNKRNPIRTIVEYIEQMDREIQQTGERNVAFDFHCDIVYLPHGDHTVIKVFTEKKEFLDIIKKLKDFSYWNNTDRPDDISSEEWNQREKFVGSLTGTISSNGLSSKLTNDLRFLYFYREEFSQLLSYQPNLNSRKEYIAKELDMKDFNNKNHEELNNLLKENPSEIWPILERIGDYKRSDKSKENINKYIQTIKLKKSFTEKDLIKE